MLPLVTDIRAAVYKQTFLLKNNWKHKTCYCICHYLHRNKGWCFVYNKFLMFCIRPHQKYFLFPMVRPTVISKFPEKFLGGCGYIYRKYAGLYKNIQTLCMWRNGLRSVELVYVFPRTQAVGLVLPKICTRNEEGCSTLGLGFISNAKSVRLHSVPNAFVFITKRVSSSLALNTFAFSVKRVPSLALNAFVSSAKRVISSWAPNTFNLFLFIAKRVSL